MNFQTWGLAKPKSEDHPARNEFVVKEPSYLEVVDNQIYFYSDIDRVQVMKLNQALISTNNSNLATQAVRQQKEPDAIFLHIMSYGGDIFSGLAVADIMSTIKVPVYTIIDGCAASAATLISVLGKKRFIHKNSFMLIHQISSMYWGKFMEFQDEMENLKLLMNTIKRIYKQYTEVPEEKLDEILKHDLWFDAETCLKYKLVDEII